MSLANLILDLVAEKPSNGFEIARALEERHKVGLKGREGALYAALVQLERAGFVTAVAEEAPGGARRWRYHLPVLTDVTPEESRIAENAEPDEAAEPNEPVEPAEDAPEGSEAVTVEVDKSAIVSDEAPKAPEPPEAPDPPEPPEKRERPDEVAE